MNSFKFHNLPVQSASDLEFTPVTVDSIEKNNGNEEHMTALGRYIGSTLFHNASPEQDLDTTINISADLVTADIPEREDMSSVLKGVVLGFREEEAAVVTEEEADEDSEEEIPTPEALSPAAPVQTETFGTPISVDELQRRIHSEAGSESASEDSDESSRENDVDQGRGW